MLQQSVVWCPELLALLGQGGVISTRVLYPGARSADTKKPSGASEIPNQGTKRCRLARQGGCRAVHEHCVSAVLGHSCARLGPLTGLTARNHPPCAWLLG